VRWVKDKVPPLRRKIRENAVGVGVPDSSVTL
jgi:hypothetical protein